MDTKLRLWLRRLYFGRPFYLNVGHFLFHMEDVGIRKFLRYDDGDGYSHPHPHFLFLNSFTGGPQAVDRNCGIICRTKEWKPTAIRPQ